MKRELLIAGVGLVGLLGVSWFAARNLYPPLEEPAIVQPPPTQPEPFEPPAPDPEEDEPPIAAPKLLPMCCYGAREAVYGPGTNLRLSWVDQQGHAMNFPPHDDGEVYGHTHDLYGMACPSQRAEDYWLGRILLWPERLHFNSRARLIMADRAARRERLAVEGS